MIDDGAAEKDAVVKARLTAVLCKWHHKVAFMKNLERIVKDASLQSSIRELYIRLFASKTELAYQNEYQGLVRLCQGSAEGTSFLEYYNRTWHPIWHMWTMHSRLSSTGLFLTNNITEAVIKWISAFFPRRSPRYDELFVKLCEALKDFKRQKRLRPTRHIEEQRAAAKRFSSALKLFLSKKIVVSN
jgi:hypothetical protein